MNGLTSYSYLLPDNSAFKSLDSYGLDRANLSQYTPNFSSYTPETMNLGGTSPADIMQGFNPVAAPVNIGGDYMKTAMQGMNVISGLSNMYFGLRGMKDMNQNTKLRREAFETNKKISEFQLSEAQRKARLGEEARLVAMGSGAPKAASTPAPYTAPSPIGSMADQMKKWG